MSYEQVPQTKMLATQWPLECVQIAMTGLRVARGECLGAMKAGAA